MLATHLYLTIPLPDHPSIPWVEQSCIDITLYTGCTVNVCWCKRLINGVVEYVVTGITINSGSNCDGYSDWWALISEVNLQMAHHVGALVPTCDGGISYTTIAVATASCWKLVNIACGGHVHPNCGC